jgi:hypothetical protein
MNTDPKLSCQSCGCDPGARWKCRVYPDCAYGLSLIQSPNLTPSPTVVTSVTFVPADEKAYRKARPVYSGVLKYFPDALLAVAAISQLGNDQHNPGEPLHWARHKSTDQLDAAIRHLIDHAKGTPTDADGGSHLAKAAWRVLAELQLEIERGHQ